jgi:two-component system LytT family response regulator
MKALTTPDSIMSLEGLLYLPRFQTKDGNRSVDLKRIVYLSAQVNYTIFHLEDGESVITSLSLSFYASLLEKYGFLRLHKSYLLNLHYLSQCHILRFEMLVLPSGHSLEIARRRKAKLREMIKSR